MSILLLCIFVYVTVESLNRQYSPVSKSKTHCLKLINNIGKEYNNPSNKRKTIFIKIDNFLSRNIFQTEHIYLNKIK